MISLSLKCKRVPRKKARSWLRLPCDPAFSPELVVLAGLSDRPHHLRAARLGGLFQIPMTAEFGWGRDVFGLAIALQNLLWGIGQPFAGAIADRFGAVRVLCVGALLYAVGLVVMAYATTPGMLQLGGGVLIGFGLSGCSFNLVLGAFGKLLPEKWRPMAFGAGHGGGLVRSVPVPADRQHSHRIPSAGSRRSSSSPRACCSSCLSLWRCRAPNGADEADAARGPFRSQVSRSATRSGEAFSTAPLCCSCSASSPAASNSPSSPCTCRPI